MLPAELTGTELRLRDGGGKDVLYLGSRSGKPSKLKLGDGYFQGPLIRVWPNDNVVRIEGAGEFSMPTAVLPKTLTGSDPNRIRWTKPPFCKWTGEMVGLDAEVTGNFSHCAKIRGSVDIGVVAAEIHRSTVKAADIGLAVDHVCQAFLGSDHIGTGSG